jgi:hypothetical protein
MGHLNLGDILFMFHHIHGTFKLREFSATAFNLVYQHTLVSFNDYPSVCTPVHVLNHNVNAGIGIVRYVHSLIGLADTTISNRDVDNQCQGILARDKTLTTETAERSNLNNFVVMFFNG